MKIILEGPDGAGKTTLANQLMEKYGAKYFHSSSKTENTQDYHIDLLFNEGNVVYDRFFIGEYVYSAVFDRQCKLNNHDLLFLSSLADSQKCLIVVLYTSNVYSIFNRLNHRGGESKAIIDNLVEINSMFKLIGKTLISDKRNVLCIDIETTPNVLEVITNKLEELKYDEFK